MKVARLNDMTKGWFVGNFSPTLYASEAVEVAVKYYRAGDHEGRHSHRVATEITAVVSGEVVMCGQSFLAGDIVVLEPGDSTDFTAVTDAVTTVVKLPCVAGDKYEEE
jgi:mannose-6-phosphate isomerase-like protein (cupin superfamily)